MDALPLQSLNFASVVDALRWRARRQAKCCAYVFLVNGNNDELGVTYEELDLRSRSIAALLQKQGAAGQRIILFYSPGLDFLSAFWGCLYAGAVAVPVFPARLKRQIPRLVAIATDAQASIVLTTSQIQLRSLELFKQAPELKRLRWQTTDDISLVLAAQWKAQAARAETLALLQYTSGSTDKPKGVMVSHGNLAHNSACIQRVFGFAPESIALTWLPPYHDMGLIGGLLQPLYAGCRAVVMPPGSFLQRPIRWLQAITRYNASVAVAPNFAYDLCVRKITHDEREYLRLDSLRVALNGSEPVHHETLEQFAETFAPCGFRAEAFRPVYGLAEATLLVSGSSLPALPTIYNAKTSALKHNAVIAASENSSDSRAFVSCGSAVPDMKIVVANPDTLSLCPADRVGEIWVAGPSVAQGYWGRPRETEQTFQARLANTGEGPFLRTGDLGFVKNGQLFITGRLKDLVIIGGCNHHPHDLELTVGDSHRLLRQGCSAAFSIDGTLEERLVIVQEVNVLGSANSAEIVVAIRRALVESHELHPYAILLIEARSIYRTSSGKIQRHLCKAGFLAGTLRIVHEWRDSYPPEDSKKSATRSALVSDLLSTEFSVVSGKVKMSGRESPSEALLALDPVRRHAVLRSYITNGLAPIVGCKASELDPEESLNDLGISSLMVVELQHALEKFLCMKLPIAILISVPTLNELTTRLLDLIVESDCASVGSQNKESTDSGAGKVQEAKKRLGRQRVLRSK